MKYIFFLTTCSTAFAFASLAADDIVQQEPTETDTPVAYCTEETSTLAQVDPSEEGMIYLSVNCMNPENEEI